MRMRKKKHGAERMADCAEYIIKSTKELEVRPYVLEIGCGKGGFITESALRDRSTLFVAMERQPDVLLIAAEKAKALELANIKFIVGNADNLLEYIGEGEVSRLHLNFSDPWIKARHYKRRLTYRDFLERYKRVLIDNGEIVFKTDNDSLFEFSLREFTHCGFNLSKLTRDLHSSEFNDANIVTEYESVFAGKGISIKSVTASFIGDEKK